MPARTTLLDLQHAMGIDGVHSRLNLYAVGIFFYEQVKYRKSQVKEKRLIQQAMGVLDPSSQIYKDHQEQLIKFDDLLDLGFYYSMALFDALAETHPIEAKQMIEAIVSLDTMGRYLLEDKPIILDGVPFILDSILFRQGIDVVALKEAAMTRRSHTVFLTDPPTPVVMMTETMLNSFELVSQLPTKANTHVFLSIMAELFAHARLQDSSKLDTVDVDVPAGASVSKYSVVSFLQNSLYTWFVLSLVQADTLAIFEQRLHFIMLVLVSANTKSSRLPPYASADIYLPLFMLARIFAKTDLKHHRDVKGNLYLIKGMSKQSNALDLNRYTDSIPFFIGSKKAYLPYMRMLMTTQLALAEAHAEIIDGYKDEKLVEERIRREKQATRLVTNGQIIQNYFKPANLSACLELHGMSEAGYKLFSVQPLIKSFIEFNTGANAESLLSNSFAFHKRTDPINQQLNILSSAVFRRPPMIFYKAFFKGLVGVEQLDALDYIEKELNRLLTLLEVPRCTRLSKDQTKAAAERCLTILKQIAPCQQTAPSLAPQVTEPLSTPQAQKRVRFNAPQSLTLFSSEEKQRQAIRSLMPSVQDKQTDHAEHRSILKTQYSAV